MIRRRWDAQICFNLWLSLGFHFDHTDPSLTLHLPFAIVAFGRLKQPGLKACFGGRGIRRPRRHRGIKIVVDGLDAHNNAIQEVHDLVDWRDE